MKKTCELCGEEFNIEDFELDTTQEEFIIKCPNECNLFDIKFDDIPDLT